MIQYAPTCGECIETTAERMVVMCQESGERIAARFNDAPVVALPGMTPEDVVAGWDKIKRVVWRRDAKKYGPQKRRQRREKARNIRNCIAFVRSVAGREWGADPIADLRLIWQHLECLGWVYVLVEAAPLKDAVKAAFPKLDYTDCGVETPGLYAAWLMGNAASMSFDGPTYSFAQQFFERWPEHRAQPEIGTTGASELSMESKKHLRTLSGEETLGGGR